MERAHTFFANLIVSNPKKTNERRPQQAHPRSSEHNRKSTNFSCELLFLDPHQLFVSRGEKRHQHSLGPPCPYMFASFPFVGEFLRRPFPVTFSSGLQTSWSILSNTETICLWPKEKLGGRKKKKTGQPTCKLHKRSRFGHSRCRHSFGIHNMPSMSHETTGHLQMLLPNQRGETCLLLTQNKLQQSPTSPAANLQRGRFSLRGVLNSFFVHLLSEDELSGSTFGEVGFLPYEMWIQDKNSHHSRNSGRAKVKTLPQVQNGSVSRGVSDVKHTGIQQPSLEPRKHL